MSAIPKKSAAQIVGLGGAFMPAQNFAPAAQSAAKVWSGPFKLQVTSASGQWSATLWVWKLSGDPGNVYMRGTSPQVPGLKAIGPIAGVPSGPFPAGWIGWWRGDADGSSFGLMCAAPPNSRKWLCSNWGSMPYPPVPPVGG